MPTHRPAFSFAPGKKEGLIITTLAEQLASVQAAIAKIESSAQSITNDGQTIINPALEALYKREETLLNKIDRADRGRLTVAEF